MSNVSLERNVVKKLQHFTSEAIDVLLLHLEAATDEAKLQAQHGHMSAQLVAVRQHPEDDGDLMRLQGHLGDAGAKAGRQEALQRPGDDLNGRHEIVLHLLLGVAARLERVAAVEEHVVDKVLEVLDPVHRQRQFLLFGRLGSAAEAALEEGRVVAEDVSRQVEMLRVWAHVDVNAGTGELSACHWVIISVAQSERKAVTHSRISAAVRRLGVDLGVILILFDADTSKILHEE